MNQNKGKARREAGFSYWLQLVPIFQRTDQFDTNFDTNFDTIL